MSEPSALPSAEELGVDLNGDSEDLTAEDVTLAVVTQDVSEFAGKLVVFFEEHPGTPQYDLRRRCGILYCRVTVETASRLFQTSWLRKVSK